MRHGLHNLGAVQKPVEVWQHQKRAVWFRGKGAYLLFDFFDFPTESYLVVSLLAPEATFLEGIRRIMRRASGQA